MVSAKKIIYLDAASTCPLHPKVLSEIIRIEKNYWANPSSIHNLGIQSLDVLERSRFTIANCFNVSPSQVVIT